MKNASDYLRLDLYPKGQNLKRGLLKRMAEYNKLHGKSLSITGYIQLLIIEDIARSGMEKDKKITRLHDYIDGLPDSKKNALCDFLNIM